MNTLFSAEWWSTYMLPSGATLALFYLLYKGLVRNDTHLQSRRFLILGFLGFAMLLPFLNFQISASVATSEIGGIYQRVVSGLMLPVFTIVGEGNLVATAVETGRAPSLQVFGIIGWIYGIITMVLVGRLLFGIIRLAAFSRKCKHVKTGDATIILGANIPTAFSFFRWIFIPEPWYRGSEKDLVLRHEQVHVKQRHSLDLMLMEVVCAVQFFNPFVWLLKREMRLNHEYLADRGALKNNANPEQYFALLLQKIVSKQPILVHSFHYSSLKNRIMMQLSKPAKMLSQARYLVFIPVAFALTLWFSCEAKPTLLKDEGLCETVFAEKMLIMRTSPQDPLISSKGVTKEQLRGYCEFYDADNIVIMVLDPNVPVDERIQEREFFVYTKNSNLIVRNESMVQMTPDDLRAWIRGDTSTEPFPAAATAKTVPQATDTLEKIHITVDVPPTFPGGDEARIKFLQDNVRYPAEARSRGVQGTVFVSFVVETDGKLSNIHIVRGIGAGCDDEVIRIVESMPQWIPGRHGGKAVRVQFVMPVRFTLAGENVPSSTAGAESNNASPQQTTEPNLHNLLNATEQPLYLLDGNEISPQAFRELDPSHIKSVTVLKDAASVASYGERAAHGVVIITTKDVH
ncbi:MAG: TonB family protein [Bacteroidales bacterium]|nr:TonB family protein [Bacteroidales bacterium]